ncbi:MAG: hypothetical protein HZB95_00555 [Nitrosomonadales bacterium]|nr:hypothetical protein [Nitrosomonadales bacterium]
MGLHSNLFGKRDTQDTSALDAAVAYAVTAVEPLLIHMSGYPDRYRHPVGVAMEYARQLAGSLPGPVSIDREAYSRDSLVHVLFPDSNAMAEAITSSISMQEYLRAPPSGNEFYALMGMRRIDRNLIGMELVGSTMQREVLQQATYFTCHTIENPSPDEMLARDRVAMRFFHRLVADVKARIEQRRQSKEALLTKRKELTPRRLSATDPESAASAERTNRLEDGLHSIIESLGPERYFEDFEAVLLHPEEYLYLKQTSITLDNMGIRRSDSGGGQEFTFSELVGCDRSDWTVTIVRGTNLKYESFADRLDKAYRYLTL